MSDGPELTGSLPAILAAPADDSGSATATAAGEAGAPKDTTLPVGVGVIFSPSAVLLGAGLDFNIDKQITFGPSLQYGFDDDTNLVSATGQLKYYIALDERQPRFLPYLTAGVGVANFDKDGSSSDSGILVNIGGGARLLTGEHYRIGSELRWNFLPDDLAGEDSYFSLEIVQVVIAF
jgi:opacity protein-like surface antigen